MKEYKNHIFPIDLVVSYDAKFINEKYYDVINGIDTDINISPYSAAVTIPLSERKENSMAVGIIFNRKPNIKLITHEAFHATKMMLERISIPLNNDTEEIYAYLMGYISECIECYINDFS